MVCNALVSGVQLSDSNIHILFFFKFFSHLGYLLQNIKQSSLCYIVGPCWLPVLYIVVLCVNPKLPVYTQV